MDEKKQKTDAGSNKLIYWIIAGIIAVIIKWDDISSWFI